MPTLTNPPDIPLAPPEASLIQSVYPSYGEVILEREFGGGYSGTRVFLVTPVLPGGARHARMVTKLGPAEDLQHERDNYAQRVAGALPFSAAQVREYEAQAGRAALNYVFAGGGALGKTLSLEEYYLEHNADEVKHALTGLLQEALGESWYRQAGPLNTPLRNEYGRHLRDVDFGSIVKTVFPKLSPVEGDRVKIPGLSETYPNPLTLYPCLLDKLLEGRRSFVHGDLHLRNVLVEETSGRCWLIDFAKVQERHNLFDFIKLETYIRLMGLAAEHGAFSLSEYAQFEQALNAATLGRETTPPGNECLAKAYQVILTIRALAHNYLSSSHNFKGEYLTPLFLYCLAMMKYHQSNGAAPTQLVFLTACAIGECIMGSDPSKQKAARKAEEASASSTPAGQSELPSEKRPSAGTTIVNTGSGAVANGPGAVAAGNRGIAVGGSVQGSVFMTGDNSQVNQTTRKINTGGGAYVEGGVNTGGGDFVGGNKTDKSIKVGDINNAVGVAIGHGAQARVNQTTGASVDEIAKAFALIVEKVNMMSDGPNKTMAQTAVQGLKEEAQKGNLADESKVSQWMNFLAQTASDAFDVAVAAFASPIVGLGLVFKKIADKAKEEKARR